MDSKKILIFTYLFAGLASANFSHNVATEIELRCIECFLNASKPSAFIKVLNEDGEHFGCANLPFITRAKVIQHACELQQCNGFPTNVIHRSDPCCFM